MKHYRVIITPFAGENIREAHEWLEAKNPTYAAKWLSGLTGPLRTRSRNVLPLARRLCNSLVVSSVGLIGRPSCRSAGESAEYGIDFTEAQSLWNDPNYIEIPAKNVDEPRFLVIGKINNKHWSAITTYRNNKTRIISVALEQNKRPNIEQQRVNIDFPSWMLESLDKESRRLGVTRQSLIKIWLADRLNTQ